MQLPQEEWRSLSHSQRRALINKERRRRKRRDAALRREKEQAQLESQPGYWERLAEEEREREEQLRKEEARSRLEEEAWLRREKLAQEAFRRQQEKEEKAQREKEERENLIREEWEALQKREKEAEEKRERVRREKELSSGGKALQRLRQHFSPGQERLKVALSTEDRPAPEKPTHNPLAPDETPGSKNYGTEKDSLYCPFFLKTGACRFGDFCSRRHLHPSSSTTLLVPGMYASLGLREWTVDDRDHDASLEYEEGEMYEHFRGFYDDVFPEFAKAGSVVQFKVSCNFEPHLRGNVYVQYTTEEECSRAFQMFNGRWYAQRQLSCQYCPVQKWRNAICGLYNQNRCPKGKHCNFLHVFRNPGGAFSRADRDLPPLSPPSSRRSSFNFRREWRYRSRSRSRSRERDSRRKSRDRSRDRHRGRRGRSRERSSERYRRRRERSSSKERHHSRREEGGEGRGGGGGEDRREGKQTRERHHRSGSRNRRKKSLEHKEVNLERETDRSQSEGLENGEEQDALSSDKSDRKKRRRKSDNSPSSRHHRQHKHKRHKKHKKHSHRQAGSLGGDLQGQQEEDGEEGKEGDKMEEGEEEKEVCKDLPPQAELPTSASPSHHHTPSNTENTLPSHVAMDTCNSPNPETFSPSSELHGVPHSLSSQTPGGSSNSTGTLPSPKPTDLSQSPKLVISTSPPLPPSMDPPPSSPSLLSPPPELVIQPLPPQPAAITSSLPPPLVPQVPPNCPLNVSPSISPIVGSTSPNEHPQPENQVPSLNTVSLLNEGGRELASWPQ